VRKLPAILFSLSLVCAQVVAVAQAPVSSAGSATCACRKVCCCVTQSAPASAPAPAAPVRSGFQNQLSLPATPALVWTLPDAEARTFSPSASSPLTTAGVPLFTRHCARLI